MGKSLLLAEAAKAATAQGCTTVTAVADEFERMLPSPLTPSSAAAASHASGW